MEEETEQPAGYMPPNPYGTPQAEVGALRYQLEGDGIADNIIEVFSGTVETVNQNGERIEIEVSKPLLNKIGMAKVRMHLKSWLSSMKVFALSELDDEFIEESTISLGETLIRDFQDNWNSYGIGCTSDASLIVQTITNNAYSILQKGAGGNYLQFLTKTQNIQEIQHYQGMKPPSQNDHDAGLMGYIFGKKGKKF